MTSHVALEIALSEVGELKRNLELPGEALRRVNEVLGVLVDNNESVGGRGLAEAMDRIDQIGNFLR